MKPPRLDRALALTLLALSLLIVIVLPFFAPSGEAVADSIESAAPEGRLALALLLEGAGFEPEAWRSAPGRLPRGAHVVWAARAPRPFGARFSSTHDGDGDAVDGQAVLERHLGPDALALHDLAHYRRFVEQGGTLVLAAGEPTQAFLNEVGLDALARAAVGARGADGERVRGALAFAADDERIDVDWPAAGVLAADAVAEALAELDGVGPVAWSAPVGDGRIVVLGDDGFALNGDVDALGVGAAAGLGLRQHGLLAVRLVERLTQAAPGGRLLFDEVPLGRWRPETALGLATSGARGLLLIQLALLFGVLVWRATWVREFPRDPEPLERVSPLARARAQASLYARARRFDLLARALRRGVLDALARRLGRRPLRTALAADAPGAAGDRAAPELGPGLGLELARVVAALGIEEAERARWEAAFLGPAPRDAAGLAALGAELAALERASIPTAAARPRRARARRRASGIVPAHATPAREHEPAAPPDANDRTRSDR